MDDPDSCLDSLFSARNIKPQSASQLLLSAVIFSAAVFPAEIVVGVALITPFLVD